MDDFVITFFIFMIILCSSSSCDQSDFFTKTGVSSKGSMLDDFRSRSRINCGIECMGRTDCDGYYYNKGVCQLLNQPSGTGNIIVYKRLSKKITYYL